MAAALDGYSRYAIYYAPRPGSELGEKGAAWLGYDAATGLDAPRPELDGLPAPLADLAATPRRYGFHATLKAPFALAEGATAQALDAALGAYAATRSPLEIGPLAVGADYGFVALRPAAQGDRLSDAVFEIVETFEPYRAPLSEAEVARRRRAGLTERQDAQLLAYGYPYVGADFHLHLTLTGRLDPALADAVASVARAYFGAELLDAPHTLDGLCLFGDPGGGAPFRLLARHPFTSL